jgi:hypothetical protein
VIPAVAAASGATMRGPDGRFGRRSVSAELSYDLGHCRVMSGVAASSVPPLSIRHRAYFAERPSNRWSVCPGRSCHLLVFSIENTAYAERNSGAVAKNDPFLDLTVQSTSGSISDRWNKNNRAEKVYEEAVKRLKLPAGQYLLKRARDGVILTLSEKLEDLGLVDGDVLILQAGQPQDG